LTRADSGDSQVSAANIFPSRPSLNFFFLPLQAFLSFNTVPTFSLLPQLVSPEADHQITMAATSSLDHLSNRMKLEWHSKLNIEMVPAKNFRRTSIIGTIGMSYPSSPCPLRPSIWRRWW
jgi:hypothetical protein